MKTRIPIPQKTESEILFRNQNTCCICQKGPVQIHHIDGDPGNNAITNLAVLCLEHHALASTKSSMAKGLSIRLLKKYKNDWEGVVSRRRHLATPRRQKTRQQKAWVQFEVKKEIFKLPATKQRAAFLAIVDYLYYLNLVEGFTAYLIKQLESVRWFLSSVQSEILAERMYEFFWQFVGPSKVRMDKRDERTLIAGIEFLGGLGMQCPIFGYMTSTTKQVLNTLYEFYQIGKLYKRTAILTVCRREISAIEKEWHDGKKKYGQRIPKSIARLLGMARRKVSQ